MTTDSAAAIGAIESALVSLLEDTTFARLLLAPERVGPTGIGGFVGFSAAPRGEIGGVRVQGIVSVTVQSSSREGLDLAFKAVVSKLLGASRGALARAGIHSLRMLELGEAIGSADESFERDVRFRVHGEHRQLPASAEGVIEEIPIRLSTASDSPAEPPDG